MGIWSSEPDKHAVVLTNADGTILFANRRTLAILQRNLITETIGKALHEVFGIQPTVTETIMRDIRQLGHVANQELVMRNEDGIPKSILFSGMAAYDGNENFLGTDLRMRKLNTTREVEDDETLIAQNDTQSSSLAFQYYEAQFEGLHSLLTDIAGHSMSVQLDNVVNETVERNNWHAVLDASNDESEYIDSAIYFGLLGRSMDYGITVIGRKMVEQRILSVDAKLPDAARQVAQRNGFYQLLSR